MEKRYLNPHCFMLNSLAMGDVIAAAPVVKYMVENFYTDPESYIVVAKEMFRPIFHFIPDSNFHNFENKENSWGVPSNFAISPINTTKSLLTRNTPSHMSLGQFAAIKLANMLLDQVSLEYVPLKPVDVSHFKVDFSKAVIMVSTYRDKTRAWAAKDMLDTAAYIRGRRLTPVFIGKTDMNQETTQAPVSSLPADVSRHGVDLRNKTTISELATLMGMSKAVCGIDSGPIHLAGTTHVPIVCGYTSVWAKHRIPVRVPNNTFSITPDIPCIGCESRLASHFWNFEKCYLGHIDCCKKFTADRFIRGLEVALD